MLNEVIIPVMDETTETVLLSRWLKQEGDAVQKGEVICEIETEKASVEIEASADGALRKIFIEAGTQIPPRTVVALVGAVSEPIPDLDPYYQTPKKRAAESSTSSSTTTSSSTIPATTTVAPSKEVRISPRARRLAEDNGIDLAMVNGSGPEGRIVEDDIKAAIASKATPSTAKPAGDLASRVARAKAERVSQSWRTIPHFHMSITVDLSNVVARKKTSGSATKLTYTDFFAEALAQILPQHPLLNGHWLNDAFAPAQDIRLGIVVQTERGLVIPAMRDVRNRSLEDLAAEREPLVKQALAGALNASAMAEPTFTLTNVGQGHVDSFNAIISPPQVAILAVGSLQPRALVANNEVKICQSATFTLGVDHRAVDGRDAAAFLESLKTALEH